MSDALEQALLVQFRPTFFVGQQDCSNIPAEFRPGVLKPEPETENGTIYGQVFPSKTSVGALPIAEIHYYHLWRRDCGAHGHPLDTEHVSVLVRASDSHLATATWKALYWYSAAHENTVCDVSQIARASTLHAEDHGAQVWISPGKHASYLNEILCQGGCGADKCANMVALAPGKLINLGEVRQPMNGSLFIASTAWPLAAKMAQHEFPGRSCGPSQSTSGQRYRMVQCRETPCPGSHRSEQFYGTSRREQRAKHDLSNLGCGRFHQYCCFDRGRLYG